MDAVLLTGFAHARERDTMLDLGTGTGIIPLLMEAKYHCSHLTGLEIQEAVSYTHLCTTLYVKTYVSKSSEVE